jgi:uncharacterized membrane protein YheB (UPF0754 family)
MSDRPDPSRPASTADAPSAANGQAASPDAASPDAPPTRYRNLRALVTRYVRQHLPQTPSARAPMDEPPRAVGTHAAVLPYLRAVPLALAAAFAASFAWDFAGLQLTIWGHTLVFDGLLRIVSVSGLIGFLTNWLAITMLFQPRKPRPLVGQGLVPAQRERIAFRLAEAVSDELISEAIIKEKIHESGLIAEYRGLAVSVTRSVLNDPSFRRELKVLIQEYAEELLASDEVRQRIVDFTEQQIDAHAERGLAGLALRAYRFVNEDDFRARLHEAVADLPKALPDLLDELDPLLNQLPEKLEASSEEIEDLVAQIVISFVENLDVERIVVENVRAYDERQLEDLLKRTTNEQLNYIKYLGGVLGLLGGLVIWEPVAALTLFGAVGLTIWGLDELLLRLQADAAA